MDNDLIMDQITLKWIKVTYMDKYLIMDKLLFTWIKVTYMDKDLVNLGLLVANLCLEINYLKLKVTVYW